MNTLSFAQCTSIATLTMPNGKIDFSVPHPEKKKICVQFNLTALPPSQIPCSCSNQTGTFDIYEQGSGNYVCSGATAHDPCSDITTGSCTNQTDCSCCLCEGNYTLVFSAASCYSGTIDICLCDCGPNCTQ